MKMDIPVIDFNTLNGDKRSEIMALLHEACQNWGFCMIENHGIDSSLMEKVKKLLIEYYEVNLKDEFYNSELAKKLEKQEKISDQDWKPPTSFGISPNLTLRKYQIFLTNFG
ncbi:hypothetical protein PIB30_034216 [Stylosanthes scabra]|uniref:Non-haem dioxygenase N-terminal domain-containing protein n=1 Tax=Stylosanthes scabra TaxID=79078 RepID=A0ABU6SDY3_9FABA|nr:hypothetical protein [Stylosanthes scabra]